MLVDPGFAGNGSLDGFVSALKERKNTDFKFCQLSSNVGLSVGAIKAGGGVGKGFGATATGIGV